MRIQYCFHYKVYDACGEKTVIEEGNYYSELIDLDIHDINAIKDDILYGYLSGYYVVFENIYKL